MAKHTREALDLDEAMEEQHPTQGQQALTTTVPTPVPLHSERREEPKKRRLDSGAACLNVASGAVGLTAAGEAALIEVSIRALGGVSEQRKTAEVALREVASRDIQGVLEHGAAHMHMI